MRGIARLASRYSSADSPPHVRGSTDKAAQRAMKPWAHPRWCGEHFIEQAHCADIPAHPRVCGEIATCIGSRLIGPGPTPACAGNAMYAPRSLALLGPPPLVQGTWVQGSQSPKLRAPRVRGIPGWRRCISASLRGYPRSRGEYVDVGG